MPAMNKISGIQEIYRPATGEAEIDIVAVHGLGGDALQTWTSKDNKVCWLNHPDFLPKYITNARVLVFGYNSSFCSVTGQAPSEDLIHHHAHNLVAELHADRKLERRQEKPIIFLCHSLGGIVVKRALAYANSRSSHKITHLHSIATCTYGIMFFGTPHHGSAKAHLLESVQKIAKICLPRKIADNERGLVSALREESETLQNITDFFVPLMKNYCIYFFWEQAKTDLKYTKDYIVLETSAAPMYDNTERAGIPADHVHMVKFSNSTSSGFRNVMAALVTYCEDAPVPIARKCAVVDRALREARAHEAAEIVYTSSKPQEVRTPRYTPGYVETIEYDGAPAEGLPWQQTMDMREPVYAHRS